jgi:hypothetical protein
MYLGLVLNRHRGSRRCRRRCLRRTGFAEAFLLDQHTDQEDGQGNSNHGGLRGEGSLGLRRSDLVEFLNSSLASNSPLYLVQSPWIVFRAWHTWLVLMVLVEYTAQVFYASSKICSEASANLHVFWIASAFAR